MLDTYDVSPDSLSLAGLPDGPDDGEADEDYEASCLDWARNLPENEAWRALVVLGWDLGKCGSERWPHDHVQSIRVAQALGYGLSDVEAQLLAGGAS